jgi:hypothetical protein
MLTLLPIGSTTICRPDPGPRRPRSAASSLRPGLALRVTAVIIQVTVALASIVSEAPSQQPPPGLIEVKEGTRRGFWFGLGVGAGGESNDIAGPGYSALFYQPTVSLRAGGTISPHLRLGGEILTWFDEQGDATASLSSGLLVAQFYPLRTLGLYFKAGLGIGRNALDFDHGFNVGDTGFAGLVGAGYELRLGRRLFLNPSVDLVGHSYNGRVGGGYTERLVNFGLGILFQSSP